MKNFTKCLSIFLLACVINVNSQSSLDDLSLDDEFPLDDRQTSDQYSDMDYIDENIDENTSEDYKSSPSVVKKETIVYRAMLEALKRPEMSQQLGQVLPILRSMSPPQRLTLAALLTAQVMSSPTSASPTLDQVVAMFGGNPHDAEEKRKNMTSALLLPLSLDIANIFRNVAAKTPEALELRHLRVIPGSARHRVMLAPHGHPPGSRRRHGGSIRSPSSNHNRRNVQVQTEMVPPPPPPPRAVPSSPSPHHRGGGGKPRRPPSTKHPTAPLRPPVPERKHQLHSRNHEPSKDSCDYFTNTLCLEVADYPRDAIMASIHRNQAAFEALLADIKQQNSDLSSDTMSQMHESRYAPDHSTYDKNRRQDETNVLKDFGSEDGYLCPSSVKYARPKRARATSGQWKFIVNTGDYTQTLRLEMCQRPHESCSFISENFRSECSQVYNYHRLLTWDEGKGLHMDIFKVPTCCSCHVQGYSFNFPPRGPSASHETSPIPEQFPGADFVAEDHSHQQQQHPRPNEGFQADFIDDPNLRPPLLTNSGQFHEEGFTETFNQDQSTRVQFNNNNNNNNNQINNAGQIHNNPSRNNFHDQGIQGSGNQFHFNDDRTRPPQFHFQNEGTQFQFQENNSRKKFQEADFTIPNFQSPKRETVQHFPKQPELHVTPPGSNFQVSTLFQRNSFRPSTPEDLKPPQGPPLPLQHETDFQTFAGNQLLRRSRNQTSLIRDDADLDVGESAIKRRPYPNIISSDTIRIPSLTTIITTTTTTTTTPRPPPPPPPPPPTPVKPILSVSAGGKRVNYNYHPIIDYFKTQTNKSFAPPPAQDWTPIVGDAARLFKDN